MSVEKDPFSSSSTLPLVEKSQIHTPTLSLDEIKISMSSPPFSNFTQTLDVVDRKIFSSVPKETHPTIFFPWTPL